MTTRRTEAEDRMTDHEHAAEAALTALDATGLRAVRLLYTDLHGVARGKDIPLRHFPGMAGDGVTFCGAVMGTDLRHTPVVGGEQGYVDLAVRPDLATLRVVPWQPEVAWCLGEAWTLDGEAHWPVCPRNLLRRAVEAYTERGLAPIVAPELEFFLVERDPAAPGGLRRYVDELSRVYTVGAVSDPREVVLRMLLWCDELGLEAFAANHEYMAMLLRSLRARVISRGARNFRAYADLAVTHQERVWESNGTRNRVVRMVDITLEYSRPFRALKLWLAFRAHGADAIRDAIERNLRQARLLYEEVSGCDDLELLCAEPQLSIVPFRHVPPGVADVDAHNLRLVAALQETGDVWVAPATVDDKICLRPCIVNYRTTDDDVRALVALVREAGRTIAAQAS